MKLQRKHLFRGLAVAFALVCLVSGGSLLGKSPVLAHPVLLALAFCSGMLALHFGRKADAE